MEKTLRLLLGDQLHIGHSWFQSTSPDICYSLMEVRTETDYVVHHIQKVMGFFAAMRRFAEQLRAMGHQVIYLRLNDPANLQSVPANCEALIKSHGISRFEYLLPDEYRLDQELSQFAAGLNIPSKAFDSEHFYTSRTELAEHFQGKQQLLMESFYRAMRKKHDILMEQGKPLFGKWNFDAENRKKLPEGHQPVPPMVFENDLREIHAEIMGAGIRTIGTVDARHFAWPVDRSQSLRLLDFFASECLAHFGSYQDAMIPGSWSLYHSRLSFSLNLKLITPAEVIQRAISEQERHPDRIAFHQLEGFVRQIIGWREYMRGIYWMQMPAYASLNHLQHQRPLPSWFWTGNTRMACLKHAIGQSLQHGYAHHIQRLMLTGNFALLAGVHPDAVDQWYLGIYIDAIQWVELPNTRGMSQYADGGLVATKPYVSSAAYIDKMSAYCRQCDYNKSLKTGEKACPFNSLYWHFLACHENRLQQHPRMAVVYQVWRKMTPAAKKQLLDQAESYLSDLESL